MTIYACLFHNISTLGPQIASINIRDVNMNKQVHRLVVALVITSVNVFCPKTMTSLWEMP